MCIINSFSITKIGILPFLSFHMVLEPREEKKKNPNYFRFICESILGNLSVTVFHSSHLSHLLKFSDQSYRRQKTLTAGNFSDNFFQRSPFPTPTIPSSAQGGDFLSFVKAPEGDSQPRAGHAHFFSSGLNLTRRHVEHFSGTHFQLQPRLTSSNYPPSVFVPSKP